MVTQEHCGLRVRYFRSGTGSGWHTGLLVKIDGKTAHIKHPVLKRVQKISVTECEPYQGVQMTIFESLSKAAQTTGFGKQTPGESDDEYLIKLLRAVQKVPSNVWHMLPVQAQNWYNSAVEAHKESKPIPACPGYVGQEEAKEISEAKPGLTAMEILQAKPPDPNKAASRFQAAPIQVTKTKGKKKITGVMDALRKVVILHPDWSSRQVYDYLRDNGYPDAKLDTISVDGGNIRRVIQLAKELGYWKEQTEGEIVTPEEQTA